MTDTTKARRPAFWAFAGILGVLATGAALMPGSAQKRLNDQQRRIDALVRVNPAQPLPEGLTVSLAGPGPLPSELEEQRHIVYHGVSAIRRKSGAVGSRPWGLSYSTAEQTLLYPVFAPTDAATRRLVAAYLLAEGSAFTARGSLRFIPGAVGATGPSADEVMDMIESVLDGRLTVEKALKTLPVRTALNVGPAELAEAEGLADARCRAVLAAGFKDGDELFETEGKLLRVSASKPASTITGGSYNSNESYEIAEILRNPKIEIR